MKQNSSRLPGTSRRGLLKSAGMAGLVMTFGLPVHRYAMAAEAGVGMNAFLFIGADNTVSIIVPGAELGQGIYTGLPKILCEELNVDFAAVQVRLPYGDEKAFANPGLGGKQTIGGSTSTFGYFPMLRKAGAAAREMLVSAAATQWKVPVSDCRADLGRIFHDASGRSVTYGQVAVAASKLPVPENPALKAPADFKLIGKSTPRKDTPLKVDGSAQFGADIILPGLLCAAVRMPPASGGVVATYDQGRVASMPGVVKIVELKNPEGKINGIAVAAESYWQARRAADALSITWGAGLDPAMTSATIKAGMLEALGRDAEARSGRNGKVGDVAEALKTAAKTLDVTYEAPYLAHACMEPIAITAIVKDGQCTVWAPTQQPVEVRKAVVEITGFPMERVTIQTVFLGGGFGRKWELDYPAQVVQIAMATGGRPVRMIWTREQDIQNDFYRPASVVRTKAGVTKDGKIAAIHSRAAVQSILTFKKMGPPGGKFPDGTAVEGLIAEHYGIPNTLSEYVEAPFRLPIGFWRSVGLSQNAFFAESAIDEIAHLAGRDPYEVRRELLKDKPRELKVLDTAAKMADWGRKLPKGHGLGIAFASGFRSYMAQVAEVSVTNGALKVHKVWCALDAGLVIDPGAVTAQVEGGIGFGLSAALFGEITVDKGGIVQSNFNDYEMVTLRTMPEVEVQLIEGAPIPTGVGEAGVPCVAPAVANAIFAANGQRLRRLPLKLAGLDIV